MLDHCSISHKGGIVLWQRSFTPAASTLAASSSSPVNGLVREALIEGRNTEEKYEKDGYAVRWTFVNELELIFVVAYQRILQLSYIEDLLAAMKDLFIKLYQPFLTTFIESLHVIRSADIKSTTHPAAWDFTRALDGWDKIFDKLLRGFEDKAALDRKSRTKPALRAAPTSSPPSEDLENAPTVDTTDAEDAQAISRNVEALRNRLKGRQEKKGGRGKGQRSGLSSASGTDTELPRRKTAKTPRKWGESNEVTADDIAELDFSMDHADVSQISNADPQYLRSLIDESSMGVKGKDGLYEVKDLDFTTSHDDDDDEMVDDAISRALNRSSNLSGPSASSSTTSSAISSSLGVLGGLFSRLTGSKVLTNEDLGPVLAAMKDHLMKKNVAKEISDKIVEGVREGLVGKRVSGFNGVKTQVRAALSESITRILTPKTSTDLLLAIRTKLSSINSSTSSKRNPYTMTFVGVNGVGKSTNLSKVCFWLLQNNFKVLIAACDTFRSGAVEQLRVHVRNLGMLAEQSNMNKGGVELYERGYGKDAAGIAKDAISYAKENGFDVVLIDTAGRMQDNEPLMRALAKLVSTNNPDKIIFVGEALVGNEAVDQLSKFDRALRDFSSGSGKGRGIDGMLVTKWDTVDDKVGAALSMTYVTGQPILFVGCGQTYTDLRQLRVAHIVQALLSD
ncbi:hypothetical protein FRC03_005354 [Tulasnella sp. 419]|nr:hypothetical protein FRC03_005354 [Tulasnella sp. 419]